MSDPQLPHGLQPTRLFCPWDLPGKSTGVGCHCLLRVEAWAPNYGFTRLALDCLPQGPCVFTALSFLAFLFIMLPNLVLTDASSLWVLDIGDKSLRMFPFFLFFFGSQWSTWRGRSCICFCILGLFLAGDPCFTSIILFLSLSLSLSLYYKCCGSGLSIPNLVLIGVWIIVLFEGLFNVFPNSLPNCRNEVLKNNKTLL